MAEQNGDELSEIDTAMIQGAFAQLAAVVLTDVCACGKSAFCACKIMIVYMLHHSVWHPSLVPPSISPLTQDSGYLGGGV